MPISQFLHEMALTAYFPSWYLRVQLLISLHSGAYCNLLWDAKETHTETHYITNLSKVKDNLRFQKQQEKNN